MKKEDTPKRSSRRKVTVDFSEPWLQPNVSVGAWERLHNDVAAELTAAVSPYTGKDAALLLGFLDIANFILKNTTGIGSNIRLAECQVGELSKETIRTFYALMLTLLAYHYGRLIPKNAGKMLDAVIAVTGDTITVRTFVEELETCKDHQDGEFSSVRAGRKLWERVSVLLRVKNAEANVTGRIYYQTAPAQDLMFIMEKQS